MDLLFFDTTSSYFDTDGEDEPVWRDKHGKPLAAGQAASGEEEGKDGGKLAGFRAYGKSKDHRDDLPQIVIGMAVTRDGSDNEQVAWWRRWIPGPKYGMARGVAVYGVSPWP